MSKERLKLDHTSLYRLGIMAVEADARRGVYRWSASAMRRETIERAAKQLNSRTAK